MAAKETRPFSSLSISLSELGHHTSVTHQILTWQRGLLFDSLLGLSEYPCRFSGDLNLSHIQEFLLFSQETHSALLLLKQQKDSLRIERVGKRDASCSFTSYPLYCLIPDVDSPKYTFLHLLQLSKLCSWEDHVGGQVFLPITTLDCEVRHGRFSARYIWAKVDFLPLLLKDTGKDASFIPNTVQTFQYI